MADWKTLADLNTAFTPFRSAPAATHDTQFVAAWKKWRDEFVPFAKNFGKTYGTTQQQLQKAFENQDPPAGIHVYPAHLMDLLTLDVENHQKTIAGWLQKEGDQFFSRWESMQDASKQKMELRADYAQRALTQFTLARGLEPGLDGDHIEKAQIALKESNTALKKAMQTLKWPGHNPDFSGPGDPEKLAAEALKLLKKMQAEGKPWSKPKYDDQHIPVAACVVGDKWGVHKRVPITQVPTQYSLKLFVAFKGTQDPDIAYGYYMYFYTQEKAGIKMAPPFYYCNSEQYAGFKILMANVPVNDGRSASVSGRGGFLGGLLRLVLSLLLILGGVSAWNQFLRTRLPQLGKFYDLVYQSREIIGLLLTIVGLFALVRTTLFHFSPLADILPQLGALILGLTMVSFQALNQKLGHETVRKGLSKIEPVAKALAPHQVLLGKIALSLGLCHLLIGGAILF